MAEPSRARLCHGFAALETKSDDFSTQNCGGVHWALVGVRAGAGRRRRRRECKLKTKTPHNDVENYSLTCVPCTHARGPSCKANEATALASPSKRRPITTPLHLAGTRPWLGRPCASSRRWRRGARTLAFGNLLLEISFPDTLLLLGSQSPPSSIVLRGLFFASSKVIAIAWVAQLFF